MVDLWSTGCIIHELATGKKTFRGNSEKELKNSVHNKYPTKLPSSFNRKFKLLVSDMLQKKLKNRLTMSEILRMSLLRKIDDETAIEFEELDLSESNALGQQVITQKDGTTVSLTFNSKQFDRFDEDAEGQKQEEQEATAD